VLWDVLSGLDIPHCLTADGSQEQTNQANAVQCHVGILKRV
jgi:hypothetical protein